MVKSTALEIAGLKNGLIKGNQWVFISPDHKAGYLRGDFRGVRQLVLLVLGGFNLMEGNEPQRRFELFQVPRSFWDRKLK